MQFNDTTNLSGMIQEAETWLFGSNYGAISGNTEMLKTFTRLINYGLEETSSRIKKLGGRWQYADTNNAGISPATTDLSNGINKYVLDLSHYDIQAIEVVDANGKSRLLKPIDINTIQDRGDTITDYKNVAGLPEEYDISGDILTLYPAPATGSVTMNEGLRVFFLGDTNYFDYTDTTKTPGIPKPFHDLPVLFACAKHAKSNSMNDKARELDSEIQKRLVELSDHLGSRNKDERNGFIIKNRSNK